MAAASANFGKPQRFTDLTILKIIFQVKKLFSIFYYLEFPQTNRDKIIIGKLLKLIFSEIIY